MTKLNNFLVKGGINLKLSIAIDGPAGAGKSTIARLLAKHYDLMYINTGYMYRAVTLFAIRNGISPNNVEELCQMTKGLGMHFQNDSLIVDDEDVTELIRTPEISSKVSDYASVPELREILVDLQKQMGHKYGVVMDGRDIGTVVLKDAPFKFYLTASCEERAKRRCNEYSDKGIKLEYNSVIDDIKKRDYIDSHRLVNPLRKAYDAVEIDSSYMSVEDVVNNMINIIEDKMKEVL